MVYRQCRLSSCPPPQLPDPFLQTAKGYGAHPGTAAGKNYLVEAEGYPRLPPAKSMGPGEAANDWVQGDAGRPLNFFRFFFVGLDLGVRKAAMMLVDKTILGQIEIFLLIALVYFGRLFYPVDGEAFLIQRKG